MSDKLMYWKGLSVEGMDRESLRNLVSEMAVYQRGLHKEIKDLSRERNALIIEVAKAKRPKQSWIGRMLGEEY